MKLHCRGSSALRITESIKTQAVERRLVSLRVGSGLAFFILVVVDALRLSPHLLFACGLFFFRIADGQKFHVAGPLTMVPLLGDAKSVLLEYGPATR